MVELRVFITGQKGWRFRRVFTSEQAEAVATGWLRDGIVVAGKRVSKVYPPSQIKRIDFLSVKPTPAEKRQIDAAHAERIRQLQAN